jgi:hypothetical protein
MTTEDPFSSLRSRAPVLSPRVFEKVRADMRRTPASANSRSRGARLLLSITATFFVLAALSARNVMRGQFQVLGWGFGVSLLVALLLLYPTLPGNRAARPRLALAGRRVLLGVVIGLVVAFFIEHAEGFSSDIASSSAMASASTCALHGLVRGGLGLALLLGIWQRTDPFSPRVTAAILGLAAGLLGVLATTLACPNHEGWHLMLGHALVVALTAGLGFVLGERFLSP